MCSLSFYCARWVAGVNAIVKFTSDPISLLGCHGSFIRIWKTYLRPFVFAVAEVAITENRACHLNWTEAKLFMVTEWGFNKTQVHDGGGEGSQNELCWKEFL